MRDFLRHLALFLALLVFGVPLMTFIELPWPWRLAENDPGQTSFMRYREEEARAEGKALTIHQEWVPLEKIPRDVRRAVLISEDDRFRQHHGIDWKALATDVHWSAGDTFSWTDPGDWAALWNALRYVRAHRDEIKGRSTVTQQLAKNLYFTPRRSFVRKIDEAVVAKRLEWFLTKDRILELYLNTVELGPGVFGVGAAARHYFGEPVQDLDLFQAASLAATLPHPLTSNPSHRPGRMAWRRDLILERLLGRDVVIPDEPPSLGTSVPAVGAVLNADSAERADSADVREAVTGRPGVPRRDTTMLDDTTLVNDTTLANDTTMLDDTTTMAAGGGASALVGAVRASPHGAPHGRGRRRAQ